MAHRQQRTPAGAEPASHASVYRPTLLPGLEVVVAELDLAVLIDGEPGRSAQMLLDVEPRQRLRLEAG